MRFSMKRVELRGLSRLGIAASVLGALLLIYYHSDLISVPWKGGISSASVRPANEDVSDRLDDYASYPQPPPEVLFSPSRTQPSDGPSLTSAPDYASSTSTGASGIESLFTFDNSVTLNSAKAEPTTVPSDKIVVLGRLDNETTDWVGAELPE